MIELKDLYQEVILDHYRKPRYTNPIENPTHFANGINPLCGDEIRLSATVEDGRITHVSHDSVGCAICVASTSLMSEATVGKTVGEFKDLSKDFYAMAKGEQINLGKLTALAGVSQFPVRVKCATLAWHTLESALAGKTEAKTE
jgi:nitrogen fixation NifU-like protein